MTSFEEKSNDPEQTKPLGIIITSGGTEVPIDDVRCLTNYSSGTTGAMLAETMLAAGHRIEYLGSRKANEPFRSRLALDPDKDIEVELRRLRDVAKEFKRVSGRLATHKAADFHDYREKLLRLVTDPANDVAILAMAASDYGPERVEGKISSSKEELTLTLKPLPKIISEIKKARPDIFLVGFKFLVDTAPDRLIETAYRSLLRDKQDLAVANVGREGMRLGGMMTYIVTAERGVIPVSRSDLPTRLLGVIEQRFSRSYYKTDHTVVSELPVPEKIRERLLGDISRLAKLALFTPCLEGDRREFGFVAKRVDNGTLVTARGSNKSEADLSELALVTGIDETELRISVTSTGKKASLDANLAHLVLARRPDVNYILHAHIPLPEAISTGRDTSPGTLEGWNSIEPLVAAGATAIHQPNHGVLLLLGDLSELPAILERNNIYASAGADYDLARGGLQRSSRFAEIVREEIPVSAAILDLAGRTGSLSRALLDSGYQDVTVADASPEMLEVARSKLHDLSPDRIVPCRIQDVSTCGQFDAVVIRQAINNLTAEELAAAFASLRGSIREGGKLVFDIFIVDGESLAQKSWRSETSEHVVSTTEGKLLENGMVLHGQRSEIFGTIDGTYKVIYDFERFHAHLPETFDSALAGAGFSTVRTIREGQSLYYICEA